MTTFGDDALSEDLDNIGHDNEGDGDVDEISSGIEEMKNI